MSFKPAPMSEYSRARRLASQQLWGVRLQVRRLRDSWGATDQRFSESRADFEFLVGALIRLRRAVELAATIEPLTEPLKIALAEFDAALPGLRDLRNKSEHADAYAFGPLWNDLDGASREPYAFKMLGVRVGFTEADHAAVVLFQSLRATAALIGEDHTAHVTEPA